MQGAALRYLQFNELYIDTDNQLLIKSGEKIALAPKVYDLLVFFCLNQHRVISKDELMEQVWSGTIVTENAISRTLVKVRKVLDDDPKSPEFIITVPRKGYRMVVDFTATEHIALTDNDKRQNTDETQDTPTLHHAASDKHGYQPLWGKDSAFKVIILTIVLLSLSLFFYSSDFQATKKITTKQIEPLTRKIGEEVYPAVSPDLTKLAYTKQGKGQRDHINIEDLKNKTIKSITHSRADLSKPVWSPTESKLAFLYQHNHVCMIYSAELDDIKNKDSWQKVSECSADSSPHFVYSPDGRHLYFNDRQSKTNGYQVFRVDLTNLQKDIINQPITSGQGNYSFDISPDGARLVILNSEFAPQTRIYTLDIASTKLSQTAKLPYLMRSVNWHHDNETIVHPSPHPAYALWQSNLAGETLAVVASNTSRVKHVSRINNGADFSFVSYLLNRDLFYQTAKQVQNTQETVASFPLDNSSVMDYLPTLANHSNQYAFVSKRTTKAEVYVATINANSVEKAQQLTFFNNPVKIYHLAFSPNDSQLAILADNQIFVVNTKSHKIKQLPLENTAVSGLSWRDEDTLLFSTVKNNDWYFMQYQIDSQQLSSLPIGYQGGIYSSVDQHYYLISDDSGQIMKFKSLTEPPIATELICSPSFINRKINLHLSGSAIVCQSPAAKNELLAYSINQPPEYQDAWFSHLTKNDFDSNDAGIIYTKMSQSVADIMRTVSQ